MEATSQTDISVINNVEIKEDGNKIIFTPIEQPCDHQTVEYDNRSWWQKIKDWWNDAPVTPYVQIRDLADPFNDRQDADAGSDGKNGVEVGIRIDF